jgi:short-subunit dehydrogenase
VGATDGIGLALARLYLGRGCRVAIVGRDADKLTRVAADLRARHPPGALTTRCCDVRRSATVVPALEAALQDLGDLDLLVYCAGAMTRGDGLTSVFADDAETIEVNVLGAVQVLGWASEHCKAARHGHIAAIGSVAGERGRKGDPAYGASKAALHAYLEGLRSRLHPFGVRVSTIKPGFVRTRMLAEERRYPGEIAVERAAGLIARGLDRRRESFYVPSWWCVVSVLMHATPRFLFKRLAPP